MSPCHLCDKRNQENGFQGSSRDLPEHVRELCQGRWRRARLQNVSLPRVLRASVLLASIMKARASGCSRLRHSDPFPKVSPSASEPASFLTSVALP